MVIIPATILSQLRDYIYAELPSRIVLLQGYTGNPNDSTDPKVTASPLGTFYLEESNPRVLYARLESNNDGNDWKLLAVLDSSTNIQDLKNKIEQCCKDVEVRLNNLQKHVNSNTRRISKLEYELLGIPLPDPPIIHQSDLDGKVDLEHTSITEVRFKVEGTGTLSIYDTTQILSSPVNIINGTPRIEWNNYGYFELIVPVEVSSGKTYSLIINPESIANDSEPNATGITCTFTTVGLPDEPDIQDADLHNATVDSTITDRIKFPIIASGDLKLDNPKAFQIIPSDVVDGDLELVDDGLGNFTLELELKDLQLDMEYEVRILKDCVSNDGFKNSYVKSAKFKSEPSQPTVLTDSTKDGLTFTNVNDVKELLFPIQTPTGRGIFNLDSTLISSTPNVTIQSTSIVSSGINKFVSVKLSNIEDGHEHTITVDIGAVDNNGLTTVSQATCTFTLEIKEPEIDNSELDGKTDADHTISEIKFPVSGTHALSIADSTKITISDPTILNGVISIVGNELVIPVTNLTEETSYAVLIDVDAIENSNSMQSKTNSYQTECNFTTQSPEPVISDSTIDGTVDNPLTLSEVRFPVSGTGILSLGNDLAITMMPNNISGKPYIDLATDELVIPITNLQPDTTYTVSVGIDSVRNNTRGNGNVKQCKFTTIDIPSLTFPTIEYLEVPSGQIEIPLSKSGLTYTGGITIDVGTITGVNVIGDKLIIDYTGLTNSTNVNIDIPVGAVSNGTEGNGTQITISVSTEGSKPVLNIPSLSNIDPSLIGVITIPVNLPTTPIKLTFDESKIYSKDMIIVGSPVFNSTTNEIEITVNLEYEKDYTISFYSGVIVADGVSSEYGELKFNTIANPSPVTPPTPTSEWEEEFILGNAEAYFSTNTLSNTLNDTLIYGTNGYDHKVKMYWIGYENNRLHETNPIEVPRTGLDSFAASNPDGGYFYDSSVEMIYFDMASMSKKVYKLIKYI